MIPKVRDRATGFATKTETNQFETAVVTVAAAVMPCPRTESGLLTGGTGKRQNR
jgi:hypothetical protein